MEATRLVPLAAFLITTSLAGTAAESKKPADREPADPLPAGLYASFETRHGTVTAELFPDLAPLTVASFVGLAEGTIPFEGRSAGSRFYDGLAFHRVVEGFVVQGGDPLGTGEGGPGYEFADEFSPKAKHDAIGTLAMANSGPNTNGSQFYFTLSPVNRLNYKHAVFGRVVRGLEVLPLIKQGDGMERVAIERVGRRARGYRVTEKSLERLRNAANVIAPRDPSLEPLFADNAMLDVPEFLPGWMNEKLHHYACVRGVTIHVLAIARFVSGLDEAATAADLRKTHETLVGNDPRSATLLFEAEPKRWHLWIGSGLQKKLGASSGSDNTVTDAILSGARKQLEEGTGTRRTIDAAVTDLIEAIDRAETVN